ncbi:MAG: FliM/FliN family flagellar motor switch protein [Novosphingobium sp.]
MKPERAFIAERPLAQHCPELIRSGMEGGGVGSGPTELLPALGRAGTKLGRLFATALSPLMGGQDVVIQVAAPREAVAADLAKDIAPLAANSLLALGSAAMLASFDAAAVLRMIDRAFGGTGKAVAPLPALFPASVGVVSRQLEAMVSQGFAAAFGTGCDPVRRSGSLVELEAFADTVPLAILTLTVEEPGNEAWPIHLALPFAALGDLLGEGGKSTVKAAASPRVTNPAEEPYCDLPLTLSAVIVDMRLPMSALARLEPGALIPVSVARNVPLRIADKTIAHGAIGSVDDRVAIQITQAF